VRIIAGSARGRTLKAPKKSSVRPTADRVKETIFNILGQWLDDERVLDLYAGAGSLGLEALSRSAAHVTFVERDAEVLATLSENIQTLGFAKSTTTLLKPVERALRALDGQAFSLVLADPPYDARTGVTVLDALSAADLLAPEARVVLEHDKREILPPIAGRLERYDERRFGDTMVSFYRLRVSEAAPPP
jgi:16S rRNA (guanine(966)-N(2))-methyltransferase RsmD